MNGVSLLLLLSSLGATTSVELGANGQAVYTIRIESLLINELRNGQTVPILVAPKDRRVRHFKIAITPEGNGRTSGLTRASDFNARAGDLFDYEATQLENGEIEYVVQISPERLESLAAGKAIEGDIAPDIVEVNRFLIFVGIGQLPSQQQAAVQANPNAPSLLNGANNGLVAAGAEVRASSDPQSRNNTPLQKNPFQPAAQPSTQRGYQANDPLTQFNTRATTDPRTNWRNPPDQSYVSPPPFTNPGQPSTSSNTAFPRTSGVPATSDRNGYQPTYNTAQPNYNATQPTYNNQYQQPAYPDPNAGYAQQNPANYPPQNYPANPPIGYQQNAATVAARNDLPHSASAATPQSAANWQQPAAGSSQPTTPPAAATTPVATTMIKEKDPERPWTPLILTTLALFASLGANAYLGWLAWSFFWRFRDAVTESARTRAQHAMSRQAA